MVAPITVAGATLAETTPTTITESGLRCHIAARGRRGILAGMTAPASGRSEIAAVTAFLDALAVSDVRAALALVDDDVVYTNVSLPTVRGRRAMARMFAAFERYSWLGFDYRMINIAAEEGVVLTERIDELRVGPMIAQFWVCGRFEVTDGRIEAWRDYFDYLDVTLGALRGLLGAVVRPVARRPLSTSRHGT